MDFRDEILKGIAMVYEGRVMFDPNPPPKKAKKGKSVSISDEEPEQHEYVVDGAPDMVNTILDYL